MPSKTHGFIRLYRDITDWGWYTEPNTLRVHLHCLLKANYTEKEWRGLKIPVGSFVTSYANLSKELKLSVRVIRTALEHLKLTHELTCKGYSQYSVITVNNYTLYQTTDKQFDKQMTNNRQASDKQLTTTNKRNKGIKEKRNYDKIFEKIGVKG